MNRLFEFLFPLRLHRLSFFLRDAIVGIVACCLHANNSAMNPRSFWVLAIALSIYELFFIILPRIRDIGMSGWWLPLCFVPVANAVFGIILLFRAPKYPIGESVDVVEPKAQTSN
jgi:uncharacterized membrane protein YhaH (DUF805 family)